MKKTIVSLFCVLALCLGLLPTAALAADPVTYLDKDGKVQTCPTATEVTASDSQWSSGWYVVPAGTVTISQRVTVNGDVHLILENGANLTIDGGISVAGSNAMTIYAQSVEEGEMGILAADASSQSYDAGIGGDGYSAPNAGAVTICGGEIIVSGGTDGGAGIGGGANNTGGAGGTVTISGGTVTATSNSGAGIGGGGAKNTGGAGGTVTISGGNVKADSIKGAGIGGGGDGLYPGAGGTVTISGGNVTATSDFGAGIGGGGDGLYPGAGGTVTISGGTVTATSHDGAGIGGGGNGFSLGAGGTFSTGTSGNAVIYSSSIQDDSQQKQWQGIFFLENQGGQVYGEMTLAEDFTIPTDKTLVIGEGQTLIIPAGVTLDTQNALTNNGTLVIETDGQLVGEVQGEGIQVTTPVITTESLDDGTVGTAYNQTQPLAATGNNITWSAIGLPAGLTLNAATGEITGTPTTAGQSTVTVTAANSAGSIEKTFTLNIKPATVSVTGLTLNQNTLALFAGDSATLTAAVTPDNATNKTLTWASSNGAVATVDQSGKVTAVAPGTAAITVTTNDGSGKVASCPVTVTAKTYALTIDPAAIGFGTVQPGYTQPAARQITVRNTGNQTLTLTQPTATKYLVGSLSRLTLAPGETATFTVQPKADQPVAVYNETILVVGNGGAGASLNLSFTVEKASGTSSGGASSSSSATTTTEKRTLHFDTNGGLPLDDVVRGLGAPVELWPYTPVRAGYLFQGWYADQALTQAVSSVVLTKDTTIYAKWAVDPAATAAPSGSGSGSGSSGSSGKGSGSQGGTTITVTPAPTASPTPTPEPTATPTPEPTATPEASAEPETDGDTASFPVVPVAAGVIVLVVLVGGIAIYRRFHD